MGRLRRLEIGVLRPLLSSPNEASSEPADGVGEAEDFLCRRCFFRDGVGEGGISGVFDFLREGVGDGGTSGRFCFFMEGVGDGGGFSAMEDFIWLSVGDGDAGGASILGGVWIGVVGDSGGADERGGVCGLGAGLSDLISVLRLFIRPPKNEVLDLGGSGVDDDEACGGLAEELSHCSRTLSFWSIFSFRARSSADSAGAGGGGLLTLGALRLGITEGSTGVGCCVEATSVSVSVGSVGRGISFTSCIRISRARASSSPSVCESASSSSLE